MRAAAARDIEGQDHVAEHVGALAFLQRVGLFDAYLAWVDGHGVKSDMDLARHYWYAFKLRRVRGKGADPGVCLEVGAGSGRFSSLLVEQGVARQFVLVDLPEMLLNAMLLIGEMFPQADIRYDETPDFTQPGLIFWMLETSDIQRVPDRSIDAGLNFYSFMEMDEQVRDFYIAQIYRAAAPGALFYNVNRRQGKMTRRDGARFQNNPLLYPYRPDDKVIEWEPDDFQQSNRSDRFIAPTKAFAISRIARVA
jgi:putative sugar O-methyltransferase